ncbi:hypothetical protein V9T40_004657 [Parthenolecanium corni]|uniref:Uncharacterized protein n=1 Tax=Parthenolecanium corni TaxID=536013 RepID=A0AAN9TGE6_9HEMI
MSSVEDGSSSLLAVGLFAVRHNSPHHHHHHHQPPFSRPSMKMSCHVASLQCRLQTSEFRLESVAARTRTHQHRVGYCAAIAISQTITELTSGLLNTRETRF